MTKPIKDDGSWIREELLSADFNELRLNKRFKIIANELSQQPSLPINQASSDWAAAKAAYRFFQNQKVDHEKIINPHILNTALRVEGHKRIVVVQDSSSLDFSRHKKTKGLGSMHTFDDGGELRVPAENHYEGRSERHNGEIGTAIIEFGNSSEVLTLNRVINRRMDSYVL